MVKRVKICHDTKIYLKIQVLYVDLYCLHFLVSISIQFLSRYFDIFQLEESKAESADIDDRYQRVKRLSRSNCFHF